MIELNNKTQQDFLNRKWVKRLLDAGVDMNDAKYGIQIVDGKDHFVYIEKWHPNYVRASIAPTYTVSELLYKLHEYIYVDIDGIEWSGGLTLIKDAPFYPAYYNLQVTDPIKNPELIGIHKDDYLYASCEHPIESLASLLIQCIKKGVGYVKDISDKE